MQFTDSIYAPAGRFGIVSVIALSDLGSKAWAIGVLSDGPVGVFRYLDLRLGFNSGISFGLFADGGRMGWTLLTVTTGFLIAVLAAFLMRGRKRPETLGLAAITGGACGNFLDRLSNGHVTDFIDVHAGEWHFPAFNLADVSITIGVCMMLLSGLVQMNPDAIAEKDAT